MTEKDLTTVKNDIAHHRATSFDNESYLRPPVDIFETDEGLQFVADVPGLDEKSLEITVENGVLTITGHAPAGQDDMLYREFSMAGYWRQFQIPDTIDASGAHAEINHGVLSLHLPKSEAAKPRRIDITTH
ncbi:MAG: Hsp20/alpha crystallin family protein [Deltaproteobacteria bacterium]|jgi:HSP20 family molecular chaperone IbpA|nr:Hsp20/alpha crystallin family protein [Deltaproteobacteria bacterium]